MDKTVQILIEALEAVEWVTIKITNYGEKPYDSPVDESPIPWCPWCGYMECDGHAPDCLRQTALATAKETRGREPISPADWEAMLLQEEGRI